MRTIKDIQKGHIDILGVVSDIARKHNIDLFAIFGTLLGAKRHGGFIPGDDDVDVAVNQRDFDKLVNILRKELPEDYKIYDQKDSRYINGNRQAGVVKTFNGIDVALDIFTIANIKDSVKKNPGKISLVYGLLFVRENRESFGQTIASGILHILPLKFYKGLANKVVSKRSTFKETKMMKVLVDDFTNGFEAEPFKNPKKIIFEGVEILIPSDPTNYLEAAYGDGKKIPSEEEKENHLHY